MYHAALLCTFLLLACYRPHRSVWLCVACVTASVLLARQFYGPDDYQLYVMRSAAAFIGATALCKIGGKLAWWHVSIYAATLATYAALEVDVALGTYSIFYETIYGALIYGLVACQIIGTFPTVRAAHILACSSRPTRMEHLFRSKET